MVKSVIFNNIRLNKFRYFWCYHINHIFRFQVCIYFHYRTQKKKNCKKTLFNTITMNRAWGLSSLKTDIKAPWKYHQSSSYNFCAMYVFWSHMTAVWETWWNSSSLLGVFMTVHVVSDSSYSVWILSMNDSVH